MSFLRAIRSNMEGRNKSVSARNLAHDRGGASGATISGRKSTGDVRGTSRPDDGSEGGGGGATYRRRSSGTGSRPAEPARYGKENPAPIVIYVDAKKPVSILRTNTFTKHDQNHRGGNGISRSDTFTINEAEDEARQHTAAHKKRDSAEPLYERRARGEHGGSSEQLPVVGDSRTYRKKSLKSSKPVQKVESFIRKFERTLFKNGAEARRQARKNSTSSEVATGGAAPRFRDIGINCKLDDEERDRVKWRQEEPREPREPQDGRRSASPVKRYATFDRTEDRERRPSGPGSAKPSSRQPTESSALKSRQKEIEMGYSVVNKKQPLAALVTVGGHGPVAERNRSILVNGKQAAGPDHPPAFTGGNYGVSTRTQRAVVIDQRDDTVPRYTFRADTYTSLKQEYEEANRKPIGIASPRLSVPRAESPMRKDSLEVPRYTYGDEFQQRRSRFREFQKSFKKMDDSASEVSYQQSFFVPI